MTALGAIIDKFLLHLRRHVNRYNHLLAAESAVVNAFVIHRFDLFAVEKKGRNSR